MVLRPFALLALIAVVVLLSGCEDTQAVADFAKAAADAAGQGPPIFRDLADTCDARHRLNANVRAAWDKPATPETEPETCATFRGESDALHADSDALQQYFEAIRALALGGGEPKKDEAGGGGGGGKSGASKAPKAGSAVGKDLTAASDLTKLAGQLAAERYQQSHLIKALKQADPDVDVVTAALAQTVTKQYQQELKEERDDADLAYFGFGKTDARNNPALLFLLNRAYLDDMASIDSRQHAAEAYVAGLQKARDAHHQLTADAASHNIKKLYAEANDYGGQIEQLVEDVKAEIAVSR